MTLFNEFNILREISFGYTEPLPLYRVSAGDYPDTPQGFTWKGNITALELSHNLRSTNSITFFLEDSEANTYLLVNEFRLNPSQGKVDLIDVIFANRDFSFAEGTSLRMSLDKPERLREGDTISIVGAATEQTLEDVAHSSEAITQEDLTNALIPYATNAEVATLFANQPSFFPVNKALEMDNIAISASGANYPVASIPQGGRCTVIAFCRPGMGANATSRTLSIVFESPDEPNKRTPVNIIPASNNFVGDVGTYKDGNGWIFQQGLVMFKALDGEVWARSAGGYFSTEFQTSLWVVGYFTE